MHDVGKLGVSAEILQKAGPLTDDEWKEMRLHPEYGYQIVKDIPSLANAAGMIRASHERWDGAGYPQGIARDEIPIGARIFILADAWDAMTSDRPYRAALPHSEALREVRVNAGTQFDPQWRRRSNGLRSAGICRSERVTPRPSPSVSTRPIARPGA